MKQFTIPCLDYELAADWYQGTSDEILLVLIGYESSKNRYTELVSNLVEATKASALVFDYGGHGESPFVLRNVTPAQNFLETITVFDWLTKKHLGKKITVMGTSYGGFMAVQLTKYREYDRMLLRVPAIYEPRAFYDPWSNRLDNLEAYTERSMKFRRDKEALAKHPLLTRAANFKGKVFIVVHENDEMVPRETTDVYIKAFNAEHYLAKNFPHSFFTDNPAADRDAYQKVIIDWLQKTK